VSENAALIDYYTNLLIIQYHNKPKARATIEAMITEGMIYDLAILVRDGFNLETAVGAQLDIIGKYVGVNRVVTGTAFTRSYYGYAEYGDVTPFAFNPMIVYGAAIPDVQFRNYKESSQSLYALTDEEMRAMIKLAIVRNNSNASVRDIDNLLYALFGSDVYFLDRQNMTIVSYMLGDKYSRVFQIAKSSGLLPNPAGVGTVITVVPDIDHIFAYSLYGGSKPTFAAGYVDYWPKWSSIGNYLQLTANYSSQAALSSTRISFYNTSTGRLQAYDFDGTDWVSVGNYLQLTASSLSSQAALSSTRISFHDISTGRLQAYDFDGIDWVAVGNYLQFSANYSSQAALSSTRISFYDASTGRLQAYDFDGTDWVAVGNYLQFSAYYFSSQAALSSTRISFYDISTGKLQAYDFTRSLIGCMASYG
jgi:hypothetical protein